MRIGEVKKLVRAYERARIPAFLSGPPGCGKSDVVRQLCGEDGVECIDIRLALVNPVDLRGIPVVRGDKVEWVPPVFLVKGAKKRRFFLDEINVAPPTVQASAYQWTLDGRIGEWEMDQTWDEEAKRCFQTIVLAGNKAEHQAIVHQMPAPLRNRMAFIEVEPNFEDFKEWALNNGVNHLVPDFLNFTARVGIDLAKDSKYGLLYFFDPSQHSATSFPTPRSWMQASRFITANPEYRENGEALGGILGVAVGAKFANFIHIAGDLPNAEDILYRGMTNIKPPDSEKNPSAAYAFCGALTAALIRVDDKEKRIAATRVAAAYCAKHWKNNAEFAVLTMKDFGRTQSYRDIFRQVIVTPEWKDFTKAFSSLME